MSRLTTVLLLCALTGCGSLHTTSRIESHPVQRTVTDPLPVRRGSYSIQAEIDPELRDPLQRYLADVVKEALLDSGAFVLVDGTEAALLAEQGIAAAPMAASWEMDVTLLRLMEKSGATVSLALASSQSKHAEADVEVRLRPLAGGSDVVRRGRGRATKGAWGLVAGVDRHAMREGRGAWKLDGSMAGLACAAAVREAVDALARAPLPSASPQTPGTIP